MAYPMFETSKKGKDADAEESCRIQSEKKVTGEVLFEVLASEGNGGDSQQLKAFGWGVEVEKIGGRSRACREEIVTAVNKKGGTPPWPREGGLRPRPCLKGPKGSGRSFSRKNLFTHPDRTKTAWRKSLHEIESIMGLRRNGGRRKK